MAGIQKPSDVFSNYYKRLHYYKTLDVAFCFKCPEAVKCNSISSKILDKVFISEAFTDSKHEIETPCKGQEKVKVCYKHELLEFNGEGDEKVHTIS